MGKDVVPIIWLRAEVEDLFFLPPPVVPPPGRAVDGVAALAAALQNGGVEPAKLASVLRVDEAYANL